MSMHDLYPKSLRVRHPDPQVYTNSRKVAAHFEQPHPQVLNCIRTLIEDIGGPDVHQRYFRPICALNEQGKRAIEYLLTRDGFSFVIQRLDGDAALRWKLQMIDAYKRMRADITHLKRGIPPVTRTLQ